MEKPKYSHGFVHIAGIIGIIGIIGIVGIIPLCLRHAEKPETADGFATRIVVHEDFMIWFESDHRNSRYGVQRTKVLEQSCDLRVPCCIGIRIRGQHDNIGISYLISRKYTSGLT